MTKFKGKYRVESARLTGWDYRNAGWYFITICTQGKQHCFGRVINCEMHLSPAGEIAHQYLAEIPHHAPATVDVFVVMPNHVHLILVLEGDVETLQCNVSTPIMSSISPRSGSVSAIIRSYKSAVARWCHQNRYEDFGWQTRFHDHIIRDQQSLERIRAYVHSNPAKWQEDCLHTLS